MNKTLVLDNSELSQMFFDNAVLWGVTAAMQGFDFCHLINITLRLNLVRRLDMDVQVIHTSGNKNVHDLFATVEETSEHSILFFPLYYQHLPLSETEIFIYSNKFNGNVLINAHKNLDYFILVKNGGYYDHLNNIDRYLYGARKVGLCTRINFKHEKWKENLIL